MKTTENIANQNKDEAQSNCLTCERTGLPVFLLRQAVIKTKYMETDRINPIYQELADYAKTLDFKNRMPDDELEYYKYVLRTLRNGYVYIMQELEDEPDNRVFHAYECIDGALRLRNYHELPNTQPRPISKACQKSCHNIPASFIHLRTDCTQAWLAFSSQPWNSETVENYLKEQDYEALFRFTKIDVKSFKDSPSEATGNRAVPFKDIFGSNYQDYQNQDSKVLEFRFDDDGLDSYKSAHPFSGLKSQKLKYVLQTNPLYQGGKPISCGVVLEDTFGIAEELNTQRIQNLHIFNEQSLTENEISLAEQQIDNFESLEHETKIYEQRAKNMLKTINSALQQRFKYYQPIMFKKRIILQLMEQYRTSIITSYDREIDQAREEIERVKNSNNDTVGYNGIPKSTRMLTKIGKLCEDKTQALNDFDSCVNQGEVNTFNRELESAYQEVINYHKEWSLDYFIYVRWLFGKDGFVSKFSKTQPKSVNANHFWLREFDLNNETMRIAHASEVGSILIDTTHSEIKLDQDSALWDELLSNPESIYYIAEYNNTKGIDRDETVYVDLENNQLLTPKDVVSNGTNFLGTVYNTSVAHKIETDAKQKIEILEKNKTELETKIEQNKQKIDELDQQKKQIPVSDPIAQDALRRQKQVYETKLMELKKSLEAINKELANIADPNQHTSVLTESGESLLNRTALKKQAILAKDTKLKPIESYWMRLNAFDELARLGALPVEINIQIRPENIVKIQSLFTQMHRGFYNRGIYHPHELELLQSIDIDEQVSKTGSIKTKKAKFTLCFPDKASKTVFMDFIKSTNGTLSPHNLKQFIEQNYKKYFQLVYKQKTLLESIDINNKGKATTVDILDKTSDEAIAKAKAKIEKQSSTAAEAINKMEQEKDKITNKIKVKSAIKNVRTGQKTFGVNLAVSGILGTITLMNMSDMLKEWDEFKEGNGETELRMQMVNALVSLVLTGVDLTSQYRNIKLNMQLLQGINTGKNVTRIEAKIRLNSIISKTAAKASTAIIVLEAIGELRSAFDMRNMEDSSYCYMRGIGAFFLGFGAIIALAGSWITVIIGVVLAVVGNFMILFSKKYDNFTAIQHWLNRCCFGKQQEFAYLGYEAYHEDESSTHSGFGLALNDYAIMTYNIQTFIRLEQLFVDSPYSIVSDSPAYMLQEHVYFYLDIPNFAKASQNESAIAMIRLFTNDSNSTENQQDEITEKYMDITCRITPQHINVVDIKNHTGSKGFIWTDKKSPFDKYEPKVESNIGPTVTTYNNITDPTEFKLTLSANYDMNDALTQSEDPIRNELIINKWIAGTICAGIIKKYQIIIQYNNREEVPLIITQKNKIK